MFHFRKKFTLNSWFLLKSWHVIKQVMSSTTKLFKQELKSPLLDNVMTPELLTITDAFLNGGYEIRLVGGVVRDILLGVLPKDIDLSTNATLEQMVQVFSANNIKYIETGLEHGTLTAHVNHKDFEVTTLRYDTEQDGRWAKVVFTNDWKLDAERRDLTINAMSMDTNFMIYDYFNGLEDVKHRNIRFVGEAKQRIKEDFLRILRYFRFYGRISKVPDGHDGELLKVIKECAPGLKNIAHERIWMELSKILVGKFAPCLMKHIYNLDIAKYIGLPVESDEKLARFEKVWNNMQQYDPQAVTLLVTLVDKVKEVDALVTNMRLSNAEKQLGQFIVANQGPMKHEMTLKPYQDIIVSAPVKKQESIRQNVIELLHYQGKIELAKEIEGWAIPLFPVGGNDLKKLNIKPGPELGKILNRLKEAWKESYFVLTKQELLEKVGTV